jgi:hypothetical protein
MKFFTVLFLFFICVINEVPAQSFQTGEIAIVLSDYGRVRVVKDSVAGVRQIDRSSFLAGVNQNNVFSYKLSAESEEPMLNVENPAISDFEIAGSINNTYDTLGQSPDFLVKHNAYGWMGTGYALVKFTVINREAAALTTVLGMEMISQLDGSYGLETVEYLPDTKIISSYRLPTSTYVGYRLLSHPMPTLRSFEWYAGYNDVNSDLFGWLTYNMIDTLYDSGGDGAVTVFASDEVTIAPGDSAIMWVGISIGDDEAGMVSNMNLAVARYNTIADLKEVSSAVPTGYGLSQNYPNPFNPSTTIQFMIPKSEFVSVKLFDVLGNEVAVLLNQDINAGTYTLEFKSTNLPSGIYFYQLVTGSYSETKKMNLLK